MSFATYSHRKGSGRALTPGELDGKTNTEHFLSPAKAAIDFIPAFKGQGRRLPITDAFDTEASQLQEADLDLRNNNKLDRVFGNGLFEDSATTGPGPQTPGAAKRNTLFEDRQADQREGTRARRPSSDRDSPRENDKNHGGQLAARRLGSAMKSQLQAVHQGLTLEQSDASTTVEAFHEAGVPVMARPRSGLAPTMILGTERSISAWEQQLKQLIASGQREAAVKLPAPSAGMVRCYIKRVKNFFGTHCSFQMHLDAGDVFLLAARRRKKSKVSSYVVSLDLEDLKRDTPNCLAKVKANFVGTEYILWQKCDNSIKGEYDREGLCINFKQTALSTKGGPRAMFVVLPLPEVDWHSPDSGAQESLSNSLELAKRRELSPHIERKVAMLSTKPPEWDEHMKAFTLDFHGRVKEASVKNFQLVHWDHNTDRKGADLMLQFGKVEDDVYALDFAYPLNAEMAFAVALASIDTKLCYTL